MHGCEVIKCMKFRGYSAKLALSGKIAKSAGQEKNRNGPKQVGPTGGKNRGGALRGLLTLGLAQSVGGGRPGAGLRLGWASEGEAGWASGDRGKAAQRGLERGAVNGASGCALLVAEEEELDAGA